MPNAPVQAAAEGMPEMSRSSPPMGTPGPADPMLSFLAEWEAIRRSGDNVPAEESDHWNDTVLAPMDRRVATGDFPAPTTTEGAAAALRQALAAGDMEKMDASFVKAALTFLEGEGPAAGKQAPPVRIIAPPDLSTDLATVAHLVDLASRLLTNSMSRPMRPKSGTPFTIPEREGEQLSALLIVLAEHIERQMGEAAGNGGVGR